MTQISIYSMWSFLKNVEQISFVNVLQCDWIYFIPKTPLSFWTVLPLAVVHLSLNQQFQICLPIGLFLPNLFQDFQNHSVI